ncbi:quinol dehydrogenase ferredoxin subunit NapH [Pluralibacter gergoviae]|uniref:quinol dehydrogenase ferredoxin subunit NapH n=1 Tax=Pluralibacter gergoviae TaxID=61647 RepID=UPI0005EC901A|nr:quinol dehydrogenase ferredoxin subunit NapH [Pluralibacter gergoviae]KJM60750.1 quinol dehydrogenase [Pluralibacter gergoviae]OUQ90551.1 quinol dehydrogenase ferredoxin subunit NapH [Pluralibacter gergoviae]
MANRRRDAGREARQKKGAWRSRRWLILRRLSQLLVLGLFLCGPWLGVWILRGNYSGSLLLDAVPLTDPLMALQSIASGYLPGTLALVGAVTVAGVYALAGKRLFCGWVCPLNPLTDLAAWLRRRFDLTPTAALPRYLRYVLLAGVLIGSALTGTLLWEWINPVSLLGRSLVMGFGSGALLLIALFLFDLLVVEHGWCGHLCPLGALYGALGSRGALTVTARRRAQCSRCMDCFHVCPEPQVLRGPVLDAQHSPQVSDRDCMLCGRCVDVCAENVFTLTIRSLERNNEKP